MLRQALDQLLPQAESVPFRTEFVIVDQGSTDNTPQVLVGLQQRAGVPIRIVRADGASVAAARNLAIAHSRGSWLACCDDDRIAAPGWLFGLYEAALRSGADFVGGAMHLCMPDGFASAAFGPRPRRPLGEHTRSAEGPLPAGNSPASKNVLMRAEVVRQLGGFNPGLAQEEVYIDLWERARAAGHTLWFTPHARMLHVPPEHRLPANDPRWATVHVLDAANETVSAV